MILPRIILPNALGAHSVLLGDITRLHVRLVRRWLALLQWRSFQTSSRCWPFKLKTCRNLPTTSGGFRLFGFQRKGHGVSP